MKKILHYGFMGITFTFVAFAVIYGLMNLDASTIVVTSIVAAILLSANNRGI